MVTLSESFCSNPRCKKEGTNYSKEETYFPPFELDWSYYYTGVDVFNFGMLNFYKV